MLKILRDRFPQCSIIKDKDELRYSTIDEKYDCCNNYCEDYNTKCNKYCESQSDKETIGENSTDREKCLNSCYVITDLCDKNCESSRYNFNDRIYDKCLLEAKCANNDDYEYDIDCLRKNKNNIFLCCMGSCTPSNDMACTEHCNTSYDIHYNRALRNNQYLKFLEDETDKKKTDKKKTESYTFSSSKNKGNVYRGKVYTILLCLLIILILLYII